MFVYNVNRSGRLMVDRYLIQREPVSEEQGSSRADDERLVSPEQLVQRDRATHTRAQRSGLLFTLNQFTLLLFQLILLTICPAICLSRYADTFRDGDLNLIPYSSWSHCDTYPLVNDRNGRGVHPLARSVARSVSTHPTPLAIISETLRLYPSVSYLITVGGLALRCFAG